MKRQDPRGDEGATYMAAKEAIHSRKEVPKPKLASLREWPASFLKAVARSLMSLLIKSVESVSVLILKLLF